MSNKNRKKRDGIVFSTASDFEYQYLGDEEAETLDPGNQELRVMLDKKSRGGKKVTLITGFKGTENDLKDLGKLLKSKCGVGGTSKNSEILIQGDFRDQVIKILQGAGYHHVKRSGG